MISPIQIIDFHPHVDLERQGTYRRITSAIGALGVIVFRVVVSRLHFRKILFSTQGPGGDAAQIYLPEVDCIKRLGCGGYTTDLYSSTTPQTQHDVLMGTAIDVCVVSNWLLYICP